jgi:hypothetical protein
MDQSPSTSLIAGAPAARARRVLAAAVVAGLALRLVFALGYWVGKPLTLDEQEYLTLARSIADGRGFTYDVPGQPSSARRHFGRAPLYPAFLATILTVAGQDAASGPQPSDAKPGQIPARALAAVKIAQAVVGALGVWLIGILAARAAGPTAGMVAGVIGAVYPPLVWICGYALSETLYSVLALASALLLDVSLSRDTTRRGMPAFAAGVVAGLAVLTRPAMLFFVLLASLFLIVRCRVALAALMIVGALLVVSPWTVRNAHEYGRFVLVASEGGVTFWTGNHPFARGEGDLAANPNIKREYLAFEARFPDLTAEQLEPVYYREALGYIAGHPREWIALLARKAFYAVVPIGPSYRLHSDRYFVASLLSYGALLPFAIAGFLGLRRRAAQPWSLWLLAASALLVALVFFPQERFRIPVIDPTLIVCAAAWWALRPPAVAVGEAVR